MDIPVIYADLNLARTRGPNHASPPTRSPDACQCPRWHQWALKLGCAGLILLVLSVIGLSVLVVQFSMQKPTVVQEVQKNRTNATGISAPLQCPRDWLSYQDKCLFVSQISRPWNESLTDCAAKETTLLLIQDQEELTHIQNLEMSKIYFFWIGLSYTLPEKKWRWINGSLLHPDTLQITGEEKENSCAVISQTKVLSEFCSSDSRWICEKKLKPV